MMCFSIVENSHFVEIATNAILTSTRWHAKLTHFSQYTKGGNSRNIAE